MSYYLQERFDAIKREARAGVIGDYTEQYTTDLITYWNRWIFRVWRGTDWDYSKTAILFTLSAGTATEYTLASTISRIIVLGIQGSKGYLVPYTEKQFRNKKMDDTSQTGVVRGYIRRGLDSTGAIKVLFFDSPSTDTVIEGEGKTKLSKITTADITGNSQVLYFPDHIIETITEGVAGTFMTAINDPRGQAQEAKAWNEIKDCMGTERTEPDDDVTTPPPTLISYGQNRRGGTRVV